MGDVYVHNISDMSAESFAREDVANGHAQRVGYPIVVSDSVRELICNDIQTYILVCRELFTMHLLDDIGHWNSIIEIMLNVL